MKVLMLGWELPPFISGGLGVASEGIAEGIADLGHQVDFLLPLKKSSHKNSKFKILDASKLSIDFSIWQKEIKVSETLKETEIGTRLIPYLPAEIFVIARERQVVVDKLEDKEESALLDKVALTGEYLDTLISETSKYALLAAQHTLKNKYDIIHAHDWVTFKAGAMCAKEAGVPLYTHCHSTEFDRNGSYAQEAVIQEEKRGFDASSKIFCVSSMIKKTIIEKYSVDPSKVIVVPNSTNLSVKKGKSTAKKKKTVAFIGRFTHQKGPYTFVDIARDLTNRGGDYKFKMIGDGYLMNGLKNKVNQLNLTDRFEFTGFLKREKVLESLQKTDLIITPSNSEPFGLVMLEAILSKVPVIAVRGTGLAEFIPSLPEVDHWDTYNYIQTAEQILEDNKTRKGLIDSCLSEAKELSWEKTSKIIVKAYQTGK